MKILFLSRYQNKLSRGAENFVSELSKRLAKNHQVDILTGKEADDFSKIISGKYDLIIPINGGLQSLKVSLGRLIRGYKILITGHSGVGRDDIWNIAVARPEVFVALTDFMANWVRKWAWGTRVIKISNGIDLDRFSPKGEKITLDLPRPIVLSVGALVWYKHHQKAIEALSKIGKGSLLIVGTGPLEKELIKSGKEKLNNRFMISSFKYEDMPKLYRSCDLFTLPSWDREAFGIVYLEAMASGLGVVAPNDSARNEIIGEAGILTDVSDPEKYAQAIDRALNINWKEKALNQAKKFSWEKVTKQYEEAFERIT